MLLDKFKSNIQKPDTDQHVLALDIGTEFVKALIGRIEDDQIKIVGVGRKHQELSDMHSGAIADIGAVVRNCEAALSEAEAQAGRQVKKVVIGIAGELVKGITNTIHYKRPQPDSPLDVREMEFIIEKVHERAQTKAQKLIAWETGNADVEVKLVNSAIVSINIDGYKVSNPIGFQGRDVAIQIYTAFAPMVHIGALERTAQELDLDLIAVAAEPFAVSRAVLGTDAGSNLTAILADVGGGTTDIAVVNDGGVEGTKMFGIGGRSFTNAIANQLDLSFKEAEDVKLNLDSENTKPKVREHAVQTINNSLGVWLDGVELALSEFDAIDHLPNRILLCGGGASLKNLVDSLKQRDWHKDLPFTRKPTVQLIKPEDVTDITDETGKVTDHTLITAMGLLRVGYDTMMGSSGADTLREKFNKILNV